MPGTYVHKLEFSGKVIQIPIPEKICGCGLPLVRKFPIKVHGKPDTEWHVTQGGAVEKILREACGGKLPEEITIVSERCF
jgi:hypothetical protein